MLTDKQLRHLYRFHRRGGFYPTMVHCISQCILVYLALWFFVHVVFYVNFVALFQIPYKGPFWNHEMHDFTGRSFVVFQCYLAWIIFICFRIKDISNAYEAHVIWSSELSLCQYDVSWISWNSVMEKMNEEPIKVKQRLLRMENYLTALAIEGVYGIPDILYNSLMAWTFKRIFEIAFQITQHKGLPREFLYQANTSIYVKRLQVASIMTGVIGFIICPAIALLKILNLLIQSMTMYQQDPGSFGKNTFTQMAKAQLRDFNELPDAFNRRLFKCHDLIRQVIQYDSPSVSKEILIFIERIVMSLMGILVFLTLINQSLVTSIRIWNHNLIFWLGALGLIYLVCRTDQTDTDDLTSDPHDLLNNLVKELHFVPPHWHGLGIKSKYASVGKLYRLTIILRLTDILATLLLPLFISVWIPQISNKLINVLQYMSTYDSSIGVYCRYSSVTPDNLENSSIINNMCSNTSSEESTPYESLVESLPLPATYRSITPEILPNVQLSHSTELQEKMSYSRIYS